MPLVTSKEMFQKAYEGGYAVGAFNVNNMEIIQGITAVSYTHLDVYKRQGCCRGRRRSTASACWKGSNPFCPERGSREKAKRREADKGAAPGTSFFPPLEGKSTAGKGACLSLIHISPFFGGATRGGASRAARSAKKEGLPF